MIWTILGVVFIIYLAVAIYISLSAYFDHVDCAILFGVLWPLWLFGWIRYWIYWRLGI